MYFDFQEMWKLRSAWQCACCIFGCTLAKVIRGVAQDGFTNKVEFHHVVNSVKTKFQWNNKDFICFHGKWNSLAFSCLFSCHYPTTLLQSRTRRLADVRHGAQKHGWHLARWCVSANHCCWLHHEDGRHGGALRWPPASRLVALLAL